MFRKRENLTYETVLPKRISSTCLVKSPNAFLDGSGQTFFLCSLGESYLVIDFDQEVVGGVEVRLSCKTATHVTIIYDESVENALRREPYFCGWCEQLLDEYDLPAGTHTLNSCGRRGFRYIGLFVQSEDTVEILSASATTGNWPVAFRGSFRCNDEMLNQIWDISAATIRACMQEYYEDGVKRDGLLWVGDFRLTFLSNYYVFGDSRLARKCLLMIRDTQYECGAIPACSAQSGGHIHGIEDGICYMPGVPDLPNGYFNTMILLNYMCEYICCIDDYIQLTGDTSILPEIHESAKKSLCFLYDASDLDNPGIWKYDAFKCTKDDRGLMYDIQYDCTLNPPSNSGTKGTLLLHLYGATQAYKRIAERLHDSESCTWAEDAGRRLDTHLETYYHEKTYGRYLDTIGQSIAITMQYTAIMATLVGKEDPVGMRQMIPAIMPSWGYTMTLKLAALFAGGYTKAALDTARNTWGKMIKAGSKTCWERLDTPELEATHPFNAPVSYCHGWTAGPAWLFPQWITGVFVVEDGFSKIRIKPNLGELEWAESTVPTPLGDIMVRAERCNDGIKLYLDIPEQISCKVEWAEDHVISLSRGGQHVLYSNRI